MKQLSSDGMDLLFTSTIPPRSIILGKMVSALWMSILLFSVSMPFMIFTVLLRGIGLQEVIFSLILLMSIGLVATMGFLLLASLPTSKVFKILLFVMHGFSLLSFPSITATIQYDGLSAEVMGITLSSTALWLVLGASLSTALISPPITNRSVGVRVSLTICWLVSGVISIIGAICWSWFDVIEIWGSFTFSAILISMFASISDPSIMSHRVQRAIPKNRFKRLLVFPFFTGPLNGLVWCFNLGIITIIIEYMVDNYLFDKYLSWLFYGLAYALLAVFIRRVTFIRRFCSEKYTWAVALIFLLIGCIAPLLANFIINPSSDVELLWRVGNPFASDTDTEVHTVFALMMFAIFGLLNMRWIRRQIKAFHPPVIATPIEESIVSEEMAPSDEMNA